MHRVLVDNGTINFNVAIATANFLEKKLTRRLMLYYRQNLIFILLGSWSLILQLKRYYYSVTS